MAAEADKQETLVRLWLEIPQSAFDRYQHQASGLGRGVEELLSERAVSCIGHTSSKGLYIDDVQRQELDRLLGRNLQTAGELLDRIGKLSSIKVGKVAVEISAPLLARLRTRCFARDFDDWLAKQVRTLLEQYAGMR